MHRRLTINSLSNVSSYFVNIVIAFFLTPFIVGTVGSSLYGFWVLLMSFIGYASILEMGVLPAVVKLVGQYKAVHHLDKMRALLSTAFLFFLAAGILCGIVLALGLPLFVSKFVSDLGEIPHMRLVFAVIACDVLVMFSNFLFAGILYGWQLYYAKNLIDITAWTTNAILLVLFLERGQMLALAAVKLGADLLTLGGLVLVCRRVFPGLHFHLRGISRASFRELLGFGSRVFVSATTTRVATHAQPLIISTALSASATAFFAIPTRLVDYARQITWGLTTGFMPMFSDLQSRQERATLVSVYLRYTRYLFLLILPMVVVLFAYGTEFISLWIGPEYAERGRPVLFFLTTTTFVESLQPLLWRFFIGIGNLNILVIVSAASSGISILGSILLVRPLGIAGVAASILAGSVVAQTLYVRHSCRYLGMSVPQLLRQVHFRPLLAGALVLLASWRLSLFLDVSTYPELVLGCLCTVVLHTLLGGWIALSASERGWLASRLRQRWANLRRGRISS